MAIEHTIDSRVRRLLAGLNPAQVEAVTSEMAPLCIVAGAGSGKTRVLTRRIAYRVHSETADAGRILAVTFTRKAAGELRSRLGALGIRDAVAAGTFHSLAYAMLRRRWADQGVREPALLDRKVRLLGPLLAGRGGPGAPTLQAADVATEIEWAKARGVTPARYEAEADAAGRTPPMPSAAMAAVYQRYEDEKRRKGLIDFDDLLAACALALETDDEFAAAQRWRFRHLFVDEFQDVNPVQYRLLRGWLGPRSDLCVVGDPNQAIYSWNGADPSYLTDFLHHFPTAGIVRLAQNYRSTPQVLAAANAVLDSSSASAGVVLEATRPDGAVPTIRAFESETAEARGIARALRGHHGPSRPWSHMAILCRTNAQSVEFEKALRAAGIPCRVRGGGAFLQQPEVRDALAVLRRAPTSVAFSSTLADLEEALPAAPAATGVAAGDDDRRASVENLIRLGREYAVTDERPSVAGFVAWLSATVRGGDDTADGGDAVEIATFHRAKGLEWPVVFVTGLEQGLVPIKRASSPEAEAEERRLLYVALTRAGEQLHCSWAQRRTFGSRAVPRSPSPWLAVIESVVAALHTGTPAVPDFRSRVAAERTRLRSVGSSPGGNRRRSFVGANADPHVLDALKEWRSGMARSSKVPAYVIFHDTTLAAVAEAKPGTADELLALPGLGPVKVARYGDALLAVVAKRAS